MHLALARQQLHFFTFRFNFCFVEAVIKYKYNSLRTYFVKELKKAAETNKSGAGADDLYQSRWEWFELLLFLKDTVSIMPTKSSLPSVEVSKKCLAIDWMYYHVLVRDAM